jgi:hypothetical protein
MLLIGDHIGAHRHGGESGREADPPSDKSFLKTGERNKAWQGICMMSSFFTPS